MPTTTPLSLEHPVYIASKGRANWPTGTLAGLVRDAVPFTVFVEPQDATAYVSRLTNTCGTVREIAGDNLGLAHVRNCILTHARQHGDKWFWMLDDDLTALHSHKPNAKKQRVPWWWLSTIEPLFTATELQTSLGQISLEYDQFAWQKPGKVSHNSYADCCVCINVETTQGLRFDTQFKLKVDRDFTLQILSHGLFNCRFSQLSFVSGVLGKPGGLHDIYHDPAQQEQAIDRLIMKWGNTLVSKQRKRNGMLDAKINWRYFSHGKKAKRS